MTPLLRRLVELLHDGSVILWDRRVRPLVVWVRAGEKWWETPVRAAMLALPAWIVIRTVRAHPKLMWPIVFIWCWEAIRAAQKAGKPIAPAAAAMPEPAVDDQPEVSPERFLELVRTAIGPHKAVHLVTLVERLIEEHPGRPWDSPAVRDLAAAAGVPVTPTVRAPGRKPTVGIYARDLPALFDLSPVAEQGPDVAVVVAGQPATTPPTTGPATTPATPAAEPSEEGFVVEDDPANPHRALVHWPA